MAIGFDDGEIYENEFNLSAGQALVSIPKDNNGSFPNPMDQKVAQQKVGPQTLDMLRKSNTGIASSKDPVWTEGTPEQIRKDIDEILSRSQEDIDEQHRRTDEILRQNSTENFNMQLLGGPWDAGAMRIRKNLKGIQEYLKNLPDDVEAFDLEDGTVIFRKKADPKDLISSVAGQQYAQASTGTMTDATSAPITPPTGSNDPEWAALEKDLGLPSDGNDRRPAVNTTLDKVGDIAQGFVTGLIDSGITATKGWKDLMDGKINPQSPEAVDVMAEIASLYGGGGLATAPMRPGVGVFGGKLAMTANHSLGAKARLLDMDGVSQDKILKETGWFKGTDGNWKFEIDDSKSTLGRVAANKNFLKDVEAGKLEGKIFGIQDFFNHPELFKAYPALKNIDVSVLPKDSGWGGIMYINKNDEGRVVGYSIKLAPEMFKNPDNLRSVLLHELQHAVQVKEGFAQGAFYPDRINTGWEENIRFLAKDVDAIKSKINPWTEADIDTYVKFNKAKKLQKEMESVGLKEAQANYRRTAGEVEARNVEARRSMSAEERRNLHPKRSEDTPEELQIVSKEGILYEPYGPNLEGREGVMEYLKYKEELSNALDSLSKKKVYYEGDTSLNLKGQGATGSKSPYEDLIPEMRELLEKRDKKELERIKKEVLTDENLDKVIDVLNKIQKPTKH